MLAVNHCEFKKFCRANSFQNITMASRQLRFDFYWSMCNMMPVWLVHFRDTFDSRSISYSSYCSERDTYQASSFVVIMKLFRSSNRPPILKDRRAVTTPHRSLSLTSTAASYDSDFWRPNHLRASIALSLVGSLSHWTIIVVDAFPLPTRVLVAVGRTGKTSSTLKRLTAHWSHIVCLC